MAEEKKAVSSRHNVVMEDRRNLTITGVTDIDSFDEEAVAVFTDEGELLVRGYNLHINRIDVDAGELSLEAEVVSLEYSDNVSAKGSIWSRLFR